MVFRHWERKLNLCGHNRKLLCLGSIRLWF